MPCLFIGLLAGSGALLARVLVLPGTDHVLERKVLVFERLLGQNELHRHLLLARLNPLALLRVVAQLGVLEGVTLCTHSHSELVVLVDEHLLRNGALPTKSASTMPFSCFSSSLSALAATMHSVLALSFYDVDVEPADCDGRLEVHERNFVRNDRDVMAPADWFCAR